MQSNEWTVDISDSVVCDYKVYESLTELNAIVPSLNAEIIVCENRSTTACWSGTSEVIALEENKVYWFPMQVRSLLINYRADLRIHRIQVNPIISDQLTQKWSVKKGQLWALDWENSCNRRNLFGLIAYLESTLQHMLHEIPDYRFDVIQEAMNYTVKSLGMCSVEEMYQHCCVTKEVLERRFKLLKITPRDMTRIVRMNRFITLFNESTLNLTNCAHMSGFHDQSHLVREFRGFFSATPKSLNRRSYLT